MRNWCVSATAARDQAGHGHSHHNSAGGVESAGATGGRGCGACGRRRGLGGQHTDTSTDWRPPRGLRGLAGLRDDAPSEARGADGERAGRPRGGRRSVGVIINKSRKTAAHGHTKQPSPTAGPSGARNTSGTATTGTAPTRPGIQKTDIRIGCRPVVELGGFEPPTFSLRTRRATNCAIAPRTRTA